MCGIIGYIGKKPAFPILLSGLKRVLYRGYDSFGWAIIDRGNKVNLFKTPGRIDEWERKNNKVSFGGNLGIAHCLTADTLIQLADGRTISISEIREGDEVLSFNWKTQKIEPTTARVVKHKSPRYLYYLRTPFSDLRCTANHKMFVFSGGRILEKMVRDINKKDKLITPLKIEVMGRRTKFKEIFTKRYYQITEEINQLIKTRIIEENLSRIKMASLAGISGAYVDHLIRNDRNFREDELQKILPFLSIEFPSTHFIPQNTIHGKFLILPKESSPELMQIMGYFWGDGNLQKRSLRFKDRDKEVLIIYQGLIKKVFNIKGRIVPLKGTAAHLLEINSFYLRNWFEENIILRKREFLGELGRLPQKEVAAFLRGLFDAEGCVALKARQIHFSNTDENLCRIIQLLGLRFGLKFLFYKENRRVNNWSDLCVLYLSNLFSFKIFENEIGFSPKSKSKKLKLLIAGFKDRLGVQQNFINPQPILEIKKLRTNEVYLYDLEVTKNSNFIANGLISHNSRWATTGQVNERNAHPHFDCAKNIYLVHNGIVENYLELKEKLQKEGHQFTSECDTEVMCHLIEKFYQGSLEEAVRKTLRCVRGAYGIAVISKKEPEKIVAARLSSPLILGVGETEFIVASDPTAILAHTKKVIYLEDKDVAVITPDGLKISNLDGQEKMPEVKALDWSLEEVESGGYPHFMLKEIMEAPEAIENAIRGRLVLQEGQVRLGGLIPIAEKLREASRLVLVACGTAHFAARVGEYMLEEYADIPSEVDLASEFRYRKPVVDKNTVAVFISQSGETADTLAALREIKQKGVLTLGITNVVGSSQTRETDAGVYTRSGPEIAVASSKAFIGQLVILAMLSVYLGRQRDMSLAMGQRIISELSRLPELARQSLKTAPEIKKLSEKYGDFKNFWFIGRKYNYPIALEGALKAKELSYLHCEGIGGGELKHGPLALIDENFPTIAICPSDSVYEKMISNIQEIKARKGKVIAVATRGNEEIKKLVDDVIYIPKTLEMLTPILAAIPLHLFAYYLAAKLGCDIDKPRNLAKSVTVE